MARSLPAHLVRDGPGPASAAQWTSSSRGRRFDILRLPRLIKVIRIMQYRTLHPSRSAQRHLVPCLIVARTRVWYCLRLMDSLGPWHSMLHVTASGPSTSSTMLLTLAWDMVGEACSAGYAAF